MFCVYFYSFILTLYFTIYNKTIFSHLSFFSRLSHHYYCLHTPEILRKPIKSDFSVSLQVKRYNSTVAKFATVQGEGTRKVKRNVEYYNLDMILSVGYRVKSSKGVMFRRWANSILKDYMLKGYAINQKRLEYLEKTVQLIDIANRIDNQLEVDEIKNVLKVIGEYTKALDLLDSYDYRTIKKIKGTDSLKQIKYEDCKLIIENLKFNEKSNLFAVERDRGLEAIIGNIYQSFDGEYIYKSVEEKAANFLYLIVKNHVFVDGNKRIAATLFIYFLEFYNILYKDNKQVIDNNTLAALTLLIAESNPKEKDILVDLVTNFLNNN